jgi:geranylgeranyl diphosphate synthase type I
MALAATPRPDPVSVLRAPGAPSMPPGDDQPAGYAAFVGAVRSAVDLKLAAWLDAKVALAEGRGPAVGAVADALRQLALRGGKRLRPVLLAGAYVGCGGEGGASRVVMAGVALELLQVYLLVHDDWMDGDSVRRGGPSVPALMKGLFSQPHDPRSDAASVLAGDLASTWSREALFEVDLPAACVVGAARELARAEEDVVQGQLLDVEGAARDLGEVERVHTLKTASYSTTGPVAMGARLAGADAAVVEALRAYAEPLGVAFQLRDDVLGTFGDEAAMGKPAGGDVRAGKRTAVVVEAMQDPRAAAALRRVADSDGAEADVRNAIAAIEATGARGRVEARIGAHATLSRQALARVTLTGAGRAVLEGAIGALTERTA